jgi:hypothetical protein
MRRKFKVGDKVKIRKDSVLNNAYNFSKDILNDVYTVYEVFDDCSLDNPTMRPAITIVIGGSYGETSSFETDFDLQQSVGFLIDD